MFLEIARRLDNPSFSMPDNRNNGITPIFWQTAQIKILDLWHLVIVSFYLFDCAFAEENYACWKPNRILARKPIFCQAIPMTNFQVKISHKLTPS